MYMGTPPTRPVVMRRPCCVAFCHVTFALLRRLCHVTVIVSPLRRPRLRCDALALVVLPRAASLLGVAHSMSRHS